MGYNLEMVSKIETCTKKELVMKKTMVVLLVICLFMVGGQVWSSGDGDAGADVVTLEFFQQKREVVEIFDEIIARFEAENPGIKIEQNHIADSNQVLISRLATDDVPPILTHWPNSVEYSTAALEGYYIDLTGDPVASGALEGVIESIKLDNGKNYAVPISVNTQGIFYNVDLFDQNDLEIPETWDDFIALCEEIKAMGKLALVFPDKTAWTLAQQFRMSIALDMDGHALIDAVKAGTADSRESADLIAVAEKLIEMRAYAQDEALGTSYEQATFEFATGKAFMFWQGIWAIPSINSANPDLNYTMFPLPAMNGKETRVEYGVDLALVIGNTDPAKIEAAKKFVAFVATPEIGQYYADIDGSPSAIKGVEFNSDVSRPLVDMVQAGKSFRNIRYRYAPGGNARINVALQQLLVDQDIDAFASEVNYVFGKPE